ncbi:MAG: hypothetical protein JNM84_05885 [Planctomycetes bacterium]|nr:hypothetical protein [Planctomycetota bacterium]
MSVRLVSLLALGAALSAAPRDLSAQLVVGNDQSGVATIYEIDIASGAATPVYSASTTDAKPWGMAYDPDTNTLYWNNGGTLFSSPYGPTLTPTSVSMSYNAATVNFVALAFRNGKLLGTRNIATEAVYEIDPANGVATLLYTYPSTFDFGGLEVDATNGVLYGLSDAAPAPQVRGLYRIDVAAQTTTFLTGYPAGETDIDGLAVHDGRAYFVSDGPNTTQASFYVFDVVSGQQIGTLPSPFTGSGTFSAATFITPTGRLLMVDDAGGIARLDPNTGARTPLATLSSNAGMPAALAFDASRSALYLSSATVPSLFRLDASTGQATAIGAYGNPVIAMTGLDLDTRNDVLYGLSSHDGGLYTIDRTSGSANLVALTGLTGSTSLLYDAANDTLYATSDATDTLYSIDRGIGTPTPVGPLGASSDPSGLARNALQRRSFLVDSASRQLLRLDLATGTATAIGSTGPTGQPVALVHLPRGANILRRPHGCGTTTIAASGAAALGASFTVQVGSTGVPFLGIGLTSFELPFCNCVLGHEWSSAIQTSSLSIVLPNDPLLIGGQVALQGLGLGAPGGCPAPAFELSDTLIATIER